VGNLYKIEIDLIDKYMLREQVTEITTAHVTHAIANSVPTFRAEQLSRIDQEILLNEYLASFK
jgi:hypothetical protein